MPKYFVNPAPATLPSWWGREDAPRSASMRKRPSAGTSRTAKRNPGPAKKRAAAKPKRRNPAVAKAAAPAARTNPKTRRKPRRKSARPVARRRTTQGGSVATRKKRRRTSTASKAATRTRATKSRKRSQAAKRGWAKRRRASTATKTVTRTKTRVSRRRPPRRRRNPATAVTTTTTTTRRRPPARTVTKGMVRRGIGTATARERYKSRQVTESFRPRTKVKGKMTKSNMRNRRRYYGVRALRRARKTTLRARAYPRKRSSQYMITHDMFSNPSAGGVLGTAFASVGVAVPYAAAMFGSKFICGAITPFLASKLSGPLGDSKHVPPLAALGTLVLGGVVVPRVSQLAAYRTPVMVGLGLNAIDIVLRTYIPANYQAKLGMSPVMNPSDPAGTQGEVPVTPQGEYIQIGEYVQSELGEYVEQPMGGFDSDDDPSLRAGIFAGDPFAF